MGEYIVGDTSLIELGEGQRTQLNFNVCWYIHLWRSFAIGLMSLIFATYSLAADTRVAIVAPLTGPLATEGQEMLRAARVSVAKLKEGQLIGKPFDVELRIYDDWCNQSQAMNIAHRIVSAQDVDAVIGHCPELGHIVAQIYNERGKIFIATPIYETDSSPWDFYLGDVFRLDVGQLIRGSEKDRVEVRQAQRRIAVQAAFEFLFQAINETRTTDAKIVAYAFRNSAYPTALGMLRSGESGRVIEDDRPPTAGVPAYEEPYPPDPPVAEIPVEDPILSLPTDPHWNSWVQLPGSKDDSPLEVSDDLVYEFVLDLSLFDYEQLTFTRVASTSINPDLGKKIKALVQHDINELRLKIRPVVLGGQIEIINPEPSGYDLKLNLTKLEPSPQVRQQAAAMLEQVQLGQATRNDFAKVVQAGEIRFEIAANSPGCATVALSIWDRKGEIPYDHLVRTVEVRRREEPAPKCGDSRLRGGFKTLLDTAVTHTESSPIPVDVALHIFEFAASGGTRSVAVMVDRLALEKAAKSVDKGSKEGVYAWKMRSALSDYILLPPQLPAKLKAARDKATSGREPHPYAELAKEISEKIFTPGEDQAQQALSALQQRVSQTDRRLRLLARIISDNNEPIYLPLGLLAASATTPVLTKPLTVIQPLSRERYVYKKTCIEGWTFVIPKQLKGVTGIDLAGMDRPKRGWARWLETLESLVNYLIGAEAEQPSKQGEGLLLLAHHDSGVLWFNDAGQRAKIEDFQRTFMPGSVAVLAACSTLGVKPENRIIAKELNMMGVDAFIVSPFQVRADYGAQLAVDFAAAVEEVRSNNRQPTFVELFEQASQKTAKFYHDAGKTLDEMALEFMVLGDDNLKLCPSDPLQRQK